LLFFLAFPFRLLYNRQKIPVPSGGDIVKKKYTAILGLLLALVLSLMGINLDALPAIPDAEIIPTHIASSTEALWQTDTPLTSETTLPSQTTLPPDTTVSVETDPFLDPYGTYTSQEDVALYIHLYGALPVNFISKADARELGWTGGSLDPYAPGMCIGGDRFYNYEGLLPYAPDRYWTECDIDTLGAQSRGARRIVFSNDGLVYYTGDHYASFTLLYGDP
jgi:hypothetical protein